MMEQLLKKILICTFLLLLFIGAAYKKTEAKSPQYDAPLIKLTQEVADQNFTINKWSLYSRDTKVLSNLAAYKEEADHLKQKYSQFQWQQETKKHEYTRLSGTHKLNDMGMIEELTLVIYPQKNTYHSYLIYSVKGTSWNTGKWKEISPFVKSRLSQVFQNREQIFSCVNGVSGDKMDIILSKKARRIMGDFDAQNVEEIKEKTFISLSAYTNMWKQSIETNNHEMNLQIALRHIGNKTTLTLGTPIITTEY